MYLSLTQFKQENKKIKKRERLILVSRYYVDIYETH